VPVVLGGGTTRSTTTKKQLQTIKEKGMTPERSVNPTKGKEEVGGLGGEGV